MFFRWWSAISIKNQLDKGLNSDDNKENISEDPEKNSGNRFKSWASKFFSQPKQIQDISETNSVVNVTKERMPCSCFPSFKKKKKEPDIIQQLTALQRELSIAKKEIISSSIASIAATMISHPLDVIRSKYLMLRYPKMYGEPVRRPDLFYIIGHIIKTRGWKRLYQDHMLAQWLSLSQTIFIFWTYQKVRELLTGIDRLKNYYNLINFVAGFVSVTIPVFVLYPITKLKKRRNNNKRVLRMHGTYAIKGLYRDLNYFRLHFGGCCSLYLSWGTLYGLRFLFYDIIHQKMIQNLKEKNTLMDEHCSTSSSELGTEKEFVSDYEVALAGAIAGMLSELVAYPLDVVHSRLGMSTLRRQELQFNQTCYRFAQCIIVVLKNEGILAFYSGLLSTLLRSTVNMAAQFTIYEKMKQWLNPLLPT